MVLVPIYVYTCRVIAASRLATASRFLHLSLSPLPSFFCLFLPKVQNPQCIHTIVIDAQHFS